MDTNEQYIKMCDCPEIQNNWNPEGLDFHHRRPGVQYKHGTVVWLPRQDQLQEMLFQLGEGVVAQVCLLKEFVQEVKEYILKFTSMEQLWLAFVMKEKYDKVWDGNKWLKKPA